MIITCQQCSTSYHLDETLLKSEGTKVRCTICKTIFLAYPPAETTSQYRHEYAGAFQSGSQSEAVSSVGDHNKNFEISDDFAKAFGNSFDEDIESQKEEVNHLPSDMVHEIEENDDFDLDNFQKDESLEFEEDGFNLSGNTFDLPESEKGQTDRSDFSLDDINLSPEDLDLVNGYKTSSYSLNAEEEVEVDNKIVEDKKEVVSKTAFEDDSEMLTDEDLDLGVSMAGDEISNAFPERASESSQSSKTSGETPSSLSNDSFGELDGDDSSKEEEVIDQIDIGAELDFEFGSELLGESDSLESSEDEDLDFELSLDDSSEMDQHDTTKADSDIDEELSLGVDFDEAFESDKLSDEEDSLSFDFEDGKGITDTAEDELDLQLDSEEPEYGSGNSISDVEKESNFDAALLEDDDFDLDIELDTDNAASEDELIADADGEIHSDDDISLDIDFGLEEDDSKAKDVDPMKSSEEDFDLKLDLDDEKSKDLTLDLDSEDFHAGIEDDSSAQDEPDDLSLGLTTDDDFDLELDDGNKEEAEIDGDLDLDLSLDDDFLGSDKKDDLAASEDDEFKLELDFDGNDQEESGIEKPSSSKEETLDFDLENDQDLSKDSLGLDLDLDDAFEEDKKSSDIEAGDEELSLDFDSDESSEVLADTDDLDFSDLQDILDSDQEKERQKAKPVAEENTSDDFDLSDLENVLENDDDDIRGNSGSDDDDLELELDIESNATETAAVSSPGKDFSADLDLSEFEYLSDSDEKSPADDHFDTGDMELEFQIEEKAASAPKKSSKPESAPPSPNTSDSGDVKDQGTLFMEKPFTEAMTESVEDEDEYGDDSAPEKKGGISKLLVFLLIIALIFGGGYCAYVLLDGMGISVPFLSNYLNPKVEDPGNLKLSTEDINSKFIDNTTAGRLFVITGQVKNSYNVSRRFIQMTGKLYTKGKKLAKTEVIYCGNIVSDTELASMDIVTIKKRLSDRFGGGQKAETSIQPGKTLPFMVVFSDLPKEQLEEFTIEVDKSTAIN